METLNLENRIAKCGIVSCEKTEPSSRELAFFEYQGAGSYAERKCVNCGTYDVTHMEINPSTERPGHKFGVCEFTPKGDTGYDQFYCGCRGWN